MRKYVSYYVYGKFSEARSYMARSSKPLRERVKVAYLGWLFIVQSDDLPSDFGTDFSKLQEMLTTEPPSSWRGAVEATLARMHWRKVQICADLIVGLADQMDHLVDPDFDYRRAA